MISSRLSTLSALVLLVGGTVLLFASDVVLPRLVPGLPGGAAWLGQLVAAAWLGVAYGALMLRGPFDPLRPPAS